MLYRHPELMSMGRAKDNPQKERPLYHIDPRDGRDSLCYVPATAETMKKVLDDKGDTIGGKPTESSAEKGKAYHDHLVRRLLEVLDQLKDV
jgi:creatinine amidohydrolase